MSVFSNYLLWRISANHPISEIGKDLIATQVHKEPAIFLMGGGYLKEADLYIMKDDVQKTLCWVFDNIIKPISTDNYVTRNVKIRIATGMLNKCQIPSYVNQFYHTNMLQNIFNLVADIQGLPF